MDKSSSATCYVFYIVMVWKGSQVAKEISGRGRTRSRHEKSNQGVWDFRFINKYFITFFLIIIIIIFILSFFLYFFTHEIYPHPHPRPTPTTHDLYPLPTTFSYTLRKKLSRDILMTLQNCFLGFSAVRNFLLQFFFPLAFDNKYVLCLY